ncbi:hypothetical protein [Nesterenkonia sandarakina]|uniref:Uncharacterized protein n=1 Tax=Nesterenkonia sandarakina TaxID=272918 RepID=A0A2T0YIY5_9MICC|nr:hypothetical protein [Nesterenkonia sandarakina]PRZ15161.1 hypothetical protein BCL67_10982 [Nesterenkonia sandarakina]
MDASTVVGEFKAFFTERASTGSGVTIAQAVSDVRLDGGVLTVVFDARKAGVSESAMISTSAFKNFAEFAGVPVSSTDDQGQRLRLWVERIDTQLVSGESMGSASVAEIFEKSQLRPLEPGE